MAQSRVLIIEDDVHIVKVAQAYLEHAGYQVTVAFDGMIGLQRALEIMPDLVILDWNLPALDGLELLKRLRHERRTPVIMLTARGEEGDRVLALEVGADDYLTKPFSPRELVARVNAMLRRRAMLTEDAQEPLRQGSLVIDPAKRQVSIAGVKLDLSVLEFDLLVTLAKHPGRVFTRDELLERIWGTESLVVDRVVDVHVSNLRQKLQPLLPEVNPIETVRGIGYNFTEAEL